MIQVLSIGAILFLVSVFACVQQSLNFAINVKILVLEFYIACEYTVCREFKTC